MTPDTASVAMREALEATLGRIMNARIDLETGARKAAVIARLVGIEREARAALASTTNAGEAA